MYQYLGSTGILLYNFVGMLSAVVFIIFNLARINRKKQIMSLAALTIHKNCLKLYRKGSLKIPFFTKLGFWSALEILFFSSIHYGLIGVLNSSFGNLVGTGANYFGFAFISPLIVTAFCLLITADPLRQLDFLALALPLALVVSKIACFCHGCCGGIEWEYGLYNYLSERKEVPVQLMEAGSAFVIFIILLLIKNKLKTGMIYPIYIILYSSTRFISEFFRFEENVFLIFKTYHILGGIGIIVSVAQILFIRKFGDRINLYFEEKIKRILNTNRQ